MGSCFGKCWCSCCDCFFATHGCSRGTVPISDLNSSTSMLFDSAQNPSPTAAHQGSSSIHRKSGCYRSRADTAASVIFRSWKRRKSMAAVEVPNVLQLRTGSSPSERQHSQESEQETLHDFQIPVSVFPVT